MSTTNHRTEDWASWNLPPEERFLWEIDLASGSLPAEIFGIFRSVELGVWEQVAYAFGREVAIGLAERWAQENGETFARAWEEDGDRRWSRPLESGRALIVVYAEVVREQP